LVKPKKNAIVKWLDDQSLAVGKECFAPDRRVLVENVFLQMRKGNGVGNEFDDDG